jgi:DNA-directed RNA polymerase specialized sigma24 family protein
VALILTYYEDVSNAEGAAMLEMNIKAFESLLFRARAALRDSLATAGLVSMGDVQ